MKLHEDRGQLVGGLVVSEHDQVIAIKTSGQIVRSSVAEVAVKGRDTMGVKFVGVRGDDSVAVIALNPEATEETSAEGAAAENETVANDTPESNAEISETVEEAGTVKGEAEEN